MSAREVVDDLELSLVRREITGYWVRRADTGRTLGTIMNVRGRWSWAVTPVAFRGDGRPGYERDGSPGDHVALHLVADGAGVARTRHDVCAGLVGYLRAAQAPVLGFGPHPEVTVIRRGVNSGA